MSNRRRKRIGSQKIARNLAIRIRRGAERAGTPLPGYSIVYRHPHISDAYLAHGVDVANRSDALTASYWGDDRR